MKITPIAIAVAAAMFSVTAVAGGDKQAAQGQDHELVKQAQSKLSEQGHELRADGVLGPKTQAALKDYQSKKGLKQTGQLDQQTLAALGVNESASAGGSSSTTTEQKPQQAPVPPSTKQQ